MKEALPLISNAMLIGDKRKFLSMLLTVKVNGELLWDQPALSPPSVFVRRVRLLVQLRISPTHLHTSVALPPDVLHQGGCLL